MLQNSGFISQQSKRLIEPTLLTFFGQFVRNNPNFFGIIENSYYPLTSRRLCNLRENPNMNEQFFIFFCFWLTFGGYLPKGPTRASHNKHMSPPSPMPLKHGTLWLENMRIFMSILILILLYIALTWKGTCYCAFSCYLNIFKN